MGRRIRRLGATFFVLAALLLSVVLSVSFVKVGSALSSPVASVSDTLGPNGDTKDYSFALSEDLSDSLIHVVVNAAAPDPDRLSDISIDGHSCCYEIQGDWWGSAADTFGPLTAGQHNVTATTSLDAANQVAFMVELYEIPTPPFTIAGTFPPLSIAYNNFVRFEFNVTIPGDYLLSARASAGNFAITEVSDEIDVSGPTERTLQFTEAQTYFVTVVADILGTNEATTWSMSISPTTATTTSSTTSTLTETSSSVSSTNKTGTSTSTASTVSTVSASTMATYAVTVTTTPENLVMQVVSNSSVSGLVFDSNSGILNFTVSGTSGSLGFFNVTLAKTLLHGRPIVLVDGVEHSAIVTEDASFWYVYVTYSHSEHHITVGGAETVPEFPETCSLVFLFVTLMVPLSFAVKGLPRNESH